MDRINEYIVKVAEYGSIKKAAESCFVTSSALSKLIKNKEMELGITLFDRVGKKFEPTHAGERYIDWAKRILILEQKMSEELKEIANATQGKINFGFQMMQTDIIASEVLPAFKRKFPHIELTLFAHSSTRIINMVKDNELDLAILATKKKSKSCNYELLAEQEMVLAVPAGHPLIDLAIEKKDFRYKWIDLSYFENENFIMLFPDQEYEIYATSVFDQYNITPPVSIRVPTVELTLKCTARGFGSTITLDGPLRSAEYREKIVPLSFGESPYRFDFSIVTNKYHQLEAVTKHLINILYDIYGEER